MRLRVTDLDAWRYWRESRQTLDDFLRRMRREEPPTPAMERGIAFHEALEKAILLGGDGDHEQIEANGWEFEFRCDLDITLPVGRCMTEMAGSLEFPDLGVTMTGRADAICGNHIWDFKTTGSAPNIEQYLYAWQWRAYLRMFDAYKFTYQIFRIEDIPTDFGPKRARVVSADRLELYEYDGMAGDVWLAVKELSRLLRKHGWK